MEKKKANFCTEGISMRSVTDLSKCSKTNLETKVRSYDIYWASTKLLSGGKETSFLVVGKIELPIQVSTN